MKILCFLTVLLLQTQWLFAGIVEKSYHFSNPAITAQGEYHTVAFRATTLSARPGDPLLPFASVVLMLPPGEVAVSIEVIRSGKVTLPGEILLSPAQEPQPLSDTSPRPFRMNAGTYRTDGDWPVKPEGALMTQFLHGYSLALASVTPVSYNPARKQLSYYQTVIVRITTSPGLRAAHALGNLSAAPKALQRVTTFAHNPEMVANYPQRETPLIPYDYLVIAPSSFMNEFGELTAMHAFKGISTRVISTDSINAVATGWDLKEKIRNFIIAQYAGHGISYVLLAGNPSLVPVRGFYCYVESGSGYSDSNIPADLYYAGLDGSYDANGNHIYGEIADTADLLPELSVGRFTVNDTASLRKMIRKTIRYVTNPVLGEFARPLMAGEYLYHDPVTFGEEYMELLIDDHGDNGYFTHGIPSATNSLDRLYDTLIAPPLTIWQWSASQLLSRINLGPSFIHHLGHANTTYMLRLSMSSVTNANFAQVNGTTHNYQVLYTQGCYCGAFDAGGGCIGAKACTIDNWLAAGIFNSRYGWFNQGTTDGPSQHLQREFVNALYTDTLPEKHIGTAHALSKIATAPFVSLPGEFEPGAQRWCHYCCNLFGDPALEVWTGEPTSFDTVTWTGAVDSDWHKAGNWNPAWVPGTVCDVIIPSTTNLPVVNTVNTAVCHNVTIQPGGKITIHPGKSMTVHGTVTLADEDPPAPAR